GRLPLSLLPQSGSGACQESGRIPPLEALSRQQEIAGDIPATGDLMTTNFTLFDTAIGRCSIAWTDDGIVATQLPEGSDERARTRLEKRFPGIVESVPSVPVEAVIARIRALLAGGKGDDLSDVTLDMAR